jgi:hypothetical protein
VRKKNEMWRKKAVMRQIWEVWGLDGLACSEESGASFELLETAKTR